MSSALPTLVFLVPFAAALVIGVACWGARAAARPIALAALAGTAALATAIVDATAGGTPLVAHLGGWPPPLGIEWSIDRLGAFVIAVIAWVSLAAIAGAGASVRAELAGREPAFYMCALLLVSGLVGMAATADLFNFFVHLEVASLAAYALVAAGGRGAPRSAMRYLIIGSLGASLYLFGVGFLYAATGTLNMADVQARLPFADPRLVAVGASLIAVGLAVKMGLYPLHGWMPGAYRRAPLAASALMAPLVTKVAAYGLIRVMVWVIAEGSARAVLLELLCWAGGVAMIAGAVLAFYQRDLLRLLAYSSVSQIGLVALGIGLDDPTARTGAVLHIAGDAVMKGALFAAAAAVAVRYGIREVDALARLRGSAPWLAAAIAVAGLSLVGIPPLIGFFGKWYVLVGALGAGRPELAAAVVIGSLGTVAYVFRIVEKLYFAPPGDAPALTGSRATGATAVAVALAVAAVGLGVASSSVVRELVGPAVGVGA